MKSSEHQIFNRQQYSGDVFDHLADRKKLTPDGAHWARMAADPFHDYDRDLAGYPAADGSRTVVNCIKSTTQISNGGAPANWDCIITSLPVVFESTVNACQDGQLSSGGGSFQPANPAVSHTLGSVMAISAVAGQNLFPSAAAAPWWPATNLNITALGPDGNLGTGAARIVAMGIEIHNTTAEINKQGSVTVGIVPQTPFPQGVADCVNIWAGGAQEAGIRVRRVNAWPGLASDAAILPGSRTWEAAEGAYLHIPFTSLDNPLSMPGQSTTLIASRNTIATSYPAQAALMTTQYAVNAGEAGGTRMTTGQACRHVPMGMVFAFFGGLSNASTLQVTVKTYVETAPSYDDPLVTLASPSAAYDPRALELYSYLISHLPPGVPVNYNSFGKWFKNIVSVVKKGASTLLPFVETAVPEVAAARRAVQTVAKAVKEVKEDVKKIKGNKKK